MDGQSSDMVRGLQWLVGALKGDIVSNGLAVELGSTTNVGILRSSIADCILEVVNDYAKTCTREVTVQRKERRYATPEDSVAQWAYLPDSPRGVGPGHRSLEPAPVDESDGGTDPDLDDRDYSDF